MQEELTPEEYAEMQALLEASEGVPPIKRQKELIAEQEALQASTPQKPRSRASVPSGPGLAISPNVLLVAGGILLVAGGLYLLLRKGSPKVDYRRVSERMTPIIEAEV